MAEYVIKEGDTLTSIAEQFGLSDYSEIVKVNGIKNANKIRAGRTLIIPGRAEPDAVPTPRPRPGAEAPPRQTSSGNRVAARTDLTPELMERVRQRQEEMKSEPPLPRPRPGAEAPPRETRAAPQPPATGRGPDMRGTVPPPPAQNRTAARTDLTPEMMDRLRQRQGVGPFPARPETPGALPAAPNPYNDPSRQFDEPGPLTQMAERPQPAAPAPPVDGTPPVGNLSGDSFPPSLDTNSMIEQIMNLIPGMKDAAFGEELAMGPSEEAVASTNDREPVRMDALQAVRTNDNPIGGTWGMLPRSGPGLNALPSRFNDDEHFNPEGGISGGEVVGQAGSNGIAGGPAGDTLDPWAAVGDMDDAAGASDPWAAVGDMDDAPVADSYFPPEKTPQPNVMDSNAPPGMAETKYATPGEQKPLSYWAQLVSQAGLRGLGADLPGALYDLPNAAFMGGQWLGNEAGQWFGAEDTPSIGIAEALGLAEQDGTPFSLSDTIANAATKFDSHIPDLQGNERPGPLTEEQMGGDDMLFEAIRFALGAAGGGQATSRLAAPLRQRVAEGEPLRFGEKWLEPYVTNPGMTTARDAAAGAGAGTFSEYFDPETPFGNIMSVLGGALVGSSAFSSILNTGRGAATLAKNIIGVKPVSSASKMLVDPETKRSFPNSIINQAMAMIQNGVERAVPPTAPKDPNMLSNLAGEIRKGAQEFRDMGAPMPTVGQVTGNRGVAMTESGARSRNPGAFVNNDDALREALTGKISAMRPDGPTDSDAIRTSIDATERSYQMARDAEALPLLRQAEASGAVVDASPVVAKIDQMLMSDKRPAVRTALAAAKKALNVAGGEDLDATVSGLYEARKAIGDLIKGRDESGTGRWAQTELVEIQKALDEQINNVAPEFGQYLQKYREGSAPLSEFGPKTTADKVRNARVVDTVISGMLEGHPKENMATLADLKSLTAGDPAADLALRQTFAEEIKRRVTGSATTPSGDLEVSYAKLSKMFKDNEELLEWVYENQPGAMDRLREGRRLAEALRDGARNATSGSNTIQKGGLAGWYEQNMARPMEAILKARYGILKGGGIARTINLGITAFGPGQRAAVERLMHQLMFDPDAFASLVAGKLPNLNVGNSNTTLRGMQTGVMQGNVDDKPLAPDVEK